MNWTFESLTLPKDDTDPQACEDRVLVMPPDFAAVIDGASDISGQRFAGQTGGALAAGAIAARFADAWHDCRHGAPDHFSCAADALALANDAIDALYRDIGLTEAARKDPALRFRAAFAVVSLRDSVWRGVGAGDCALRVDDAPPILRDHPAEQVFAAWRAALIAADPGLSDQEIRKTMLGGLADADVRVRLAAQKVLDTTSPAERALAQKALISGLKGMRAAQVGDDLAFGVADGVGDMGPDFCWEIAIPADTVHALALWTDGWVVPGARTIESWQEAAHFVHAQDLRRIGPYRCIKGPGPSGRHDDMGLALIGRA